MQKAEAKYKAIFETLKDEILGGKYAKTQTKYIDQQLEEGARQLDIRLNDCYKEHKNGGYYWGDDGKNLWVCHGTNATAGTYFALDGDDDLLSFKKVLIWLKDFLEDHPTETIILNIRPETSLSGHSTAIYKRARMIMEDLLLLPNPSTGEPYLYKESGSDSYFAPYKNMPQLKDCRGKIVLLPGSGEGVSICGGFMGDSFKPSISYTDPTHYKSTEAQMVNDVNTSYEQMVGTGKPLPATASENCNFLWYWELNCTEANGYTQYGAIADVVHYMVGNTPVQVADYVNPKLVGEDKTFDPKKAGQYIGWVRMDAFEAEYAEAIWRTNYFNTQEYCTVTVESGLNDPNYPDQTYRVLKGTKLVIPGNIYKGLTGQYLNSWTVRTSSSGPTAPPMAVCYPGETFTVEEDVTFNAAWLNEGEVPVRIVWKDADNTDKLRPSSVKLVVVKEGENQNLVLTDTQRWIGAVSGVEDIKPDEGSLVPSNVGDPQLHTYGIDEPGHYKCVVDINVSGYTLTFYHTPQVMISGLATIAWEDDDGSARPNEVKIHLLIDGIDQGATTVSSDNGWKHGFGESPDYALPLYMNGEKVEYRIIEEDVAGYSIAIDGFSITNTRSAIGQTSGEVMGSVEWNDAENMRGSRPEEVTVRLFAGASGEDPKQVDSQKTSEYGLWSFYFNELPIADEQGQRLHYSIAVDDVEGYASPAVTDLAAGEGGTQPGGDDSLARAFRVAYTLEIPEGEKELVQIVREPLAYNLVYDGTAQKLVKEGSVGQGGTIMYALAEDGADAPEATAYSEEPPSATDAGTYNVWYYVVCDPFHRIDDAYIDPRMMPATIAQRPVTFIGNSEVANYTGDEIKIEGVEVKDPDYEDGGMGAENVLESGLLSGHTHNVAFSAKGTEVGEHAGTITAPDAVVITCNVFNIDGTTTTIDVTKNYKPEIVNGTLTIQQDPTMAFEVSLEGATFAYDGKPHALPAAATANALTGQTTFEYSKDGKAWTADLASLTVTDVADSCTILVRATNPNYAGVAEGGAKLAVEPVKATITVNSASKRQGEDDPAFTGKVEGLVVASDLGKVEYVRTGGDETPGVYKGVLTAKYTANSNYDVAVTKGDFTIEEPISIAKAKVTLAKDTYTCNGKAKKPKVVSVVLDGVRLSPSDYTVTYKDNVKPGAASAIVTGKGAYEGSVEAEFKIKLAKSKVHTKGRIAKSSIGVSWKTVKGAKKYELQWRAKGGAWKTATVKGTSKAVKGLERGKLYQLRVRAVAGKEKGAWSNTAKRYLLNVKGVKAEAGKKAETVSVRWKADPKANGGYLIVEGWSCHSQAGSARGQDERDRQGSQVWQEGVGPGPPAALRWRQGLLRCPA